MNELTFVQNSSDDDCCRHARNLLDINVIKSCFVFRLPYLPNSLSKLNQLEALWISPNQSKPKVQLQSEIHSKTGVRVLTNLLFPQEKDGKFSSVFKQFR